MEYIWLVIAAALGAAQKIFQKNYSMHSGGRKSAKSIYTWITAIASTLFYAILAGFNLRIDLVTLAYSSVYAVVCIVSIMYSTFVYTKMTLAKATLFSGCGGLIVPYIFDVCFLDGAVTLKKTAAVMLLMVIFIMPIFDKSERKRAGAASCFTAFCYF